MMNKKTLSSPRILELKKRRRKVLMNRFILFFVLSLFVFIGLGFLSRWDNLHIVDVEIQGNKVIDTKYIRDVVDQELAGSYLWVFPKKNFVIYPKKKIKNTLATKFTRLEEIDLSIKNGNTLEVNLSERKATYTWCGDDLTIKEEQEVTEVDTKEKEIQKKQCYFLDQEGYVFDEAPYFSGDVYFKFFGKIDRDGEDPIGNYFLSGSFGHTLFFLDNIKDIDIEPYVLFVKEDGESELYLASVSSTTNVQKIIFKNDSDLIKIVENLQAAMATEPLQTDFKEKFSKLEYIDLRFGNKVYYKFK